MEPRLDQQAGQFRPPQPGYDPNRMLTYERSRTSHAYDELEWTSGRQLSSREPNLGRLLGFLSIALGASQLLAPRAFARATGMPQWLGLYRLIGARELACGIGLLAEPRSPVWRWMRVAGDTMDAAVLGAAMFSARSDRGRLAATAALAAGITAMDVRAGAAPRRSLSSEKLPGTGGRRRVRKALAINRSPEECYRMWRDFGSFPRFMRHVESVQVLDERRSHWVASAPAGRTVEWDAQITEDQPNRLIAWKSTGRADVHNSGLVRFSPARGGTGTVVEVEMEYRPPGGSAGAVVAMLFGEEPSLQVEGDLHRFKQLIETGEIPTTRGQPHGPRTRKSQLFNRWFEPAQQAGR